MNEREKLLQRIKDSEARFRALSLDDELTGLHNRRGFSMLAEKQLKRADRSGKKALLVYVDVDDMKWINDHLGHKEGDKALTDTAAVLRAHVRQADILARIGGDEFVAVIGDASDDLPGILCERLEESIQGYRGEPDSGRTFSFSVGFAWYDPAAPSTVEELLHEADRNMYRKKREHRDAAET